MPGLLFNMKERKAILFIDGSNFYHNSKSIIDKPGNTDFNKLAKLICDYKAKDLKIRKMIKLGFDNFYRFDLEYNCQEYLKILKHYL